MATSIKTKGINNIRREFKNTLRPTVAVAFKKTTCRTKKKKTLSGDVFPPTPGHSWVLTSEPPPSLPHVTGCVRVS